MSWIDMTDQFNARARKELKVGQTLGFNYEGSEVHYKIMRKHKNKIWVKQVYLYKPEEVTIEDKPVDKTTLDKA